MVAHQQREEVRVAPHKARLADQHMGLGRGERDVLFDGLGKRLHLGYGGQRRAVGRRWSGQAREQRLHQPLGLCAVERAHDAHARAAGLQVARVEGLEVGDLDVRQRLGRGALAVGVAAIDGRGEGLGGHGAGACVGLFDGGVPARALALPDGLRIAGLAQLACGQARGAVEQVGLGQ